MKRRIQIATACLLSMVVACGETEPRSPGENQDQARTTLLGERTRLAGLRVDTLLTSRDLLQQHLDRVIEEESAALRDRIAEEAFDAVEETETALRELAVNNTESALGAMERAVGKLDVLLARRPDLTLVPLDFRAQVVDMRADPKTAERLVRRAEDLLDDGHVQEARRILEQLSSELTVTSINLPLATYPDAIREAVRLMASADTASARNTLQSALTTLVIQDRIIPLPLINAAAMIERAETLVEQGDVETAGATLSEARGQLQLAEVLGYDDPRGELKTVMRQLAELTKQVAAEENTESLFRSLKERIGRYESGWETGATS